VSGKLKIRIQSAVRPPSKHKIRPVNQSGLPPHWETATWTGFCAEITQSTLRAASKLIKHTWHKNTGINTYRERESDNSQQD
jgi:hypothetical protein